MEKTEEDWQKILSKDQFYVLRLKGTERAFTGKYWNTHEPGVYKCAACGIPLFTSDAKFDSGTGWPSFSSPISKDNIEQKSDTSDSMIRVEVCCKKCGSHLGHVFNDGPDPTGLRYCINSISLDLKKQ